MEKLELEKGADIIQSLYLDPQVLDRKPTYGGITIENEAEVILVDPKKIVVKEIEAQTELSGEELEEKSNQINQLSQKIEELGAEKDNLKGKYDQFFINISNILFPEIEGAVLAESDEELVDQARTIIKKLNDLKAELVDSNLCRKSWEGFYKWLYNNTSKDKGASAYSLELKDDLKKEYPTLDSRVHNKDIEAFYWYAVFLETIRETFVYGFSHIRPLGKLQPYNENKKFSELITGFQFVTNEHLKEADKLLEKYRQEAKK